MEDELILKAAGFLAAGLAVLPLYGVGIGLGNLFSSWLEAVARNPSTKDDLFPIGALGFALIEAIALFALLVAFIILFK